MVRIRLRRVGARHQPSYRIVAADKESPRDGRFLENLGIYNPRTEPSTVEINEERLFHWLKNGAQPSDAVVKVLKPLGTWDRWERFKSGEDLAPLLEEAETSKISVDPRTRRDDLAETRKSKKKAKAKEEAVAVEGAAPAPAEEEAAEEAAADVEEAPVEEAALAEAADAEAEPEAEDAAETEDEDEAEAEPEAEDAAGAEAEGESEPADDGEEEE
jgi:small subunit ribosomal protein S16